MAVRDATAADAAACAAIYAPYVTGTAVTFETEPPTPAEMADRIAAAQRSHAWLVLDDRRDGTAADEGPADGSADDGRAGVIGFAFAGPHKARPAYRWAAEVSVYLDADRTGRGGGRALYTALLDRLTARGYRTITAGMTLPNPASAGLHRAMGFESVGVYRRIGYKLGAWHDIALLQRHLDGPDVGQPVEPH